MPCTPAMAYMTSERMPGKTQDLLYTDICASMPENTSLRWLRKGGTPWQSVVVADDVDYGECESRHPSHRPLDLHAYN